VAFIARALPSLFHAEFVECHCGRPVTIKFKFNLKNATFKFTTAMS